MSEPSTNGPNGHLLELENLGEPTPASTSPRMLVPLFLVPLLIVGVIVGVFFFLGSVLGKEKSVEEWVQEVETGGVNERWQAAFQLSQISQKDPEKLESPEIRGRLRNVFTVAGPHEPRIRQYLAELWTRVADPEATPLIVEGIARTKERLAHPEGAKGDEIEHAEKELTYYIRALGKIGNSTSLSELLSLASHPDSKVRQVVAPALGDIGRAAIKSGAAADPRIVDALRKLNDETDAWVRMNAALALGKVGRTEGMATLETMLDRAWLRDQGLRFPDDGTYSITSFDPAEEPIANALITIESLLSGVERGGPPVDRTTLRPAVEKATADPNPEIARRAKLLLEKLAN